MRYLSNEARKILNHLRKKGCIEDTKFLYDYRTLNYLINKDFVEKIVLVPAGCEEREHPLYGYLITPLGETELFEISLHNISHTITFALSVISMLISLLK